MMNKYKYISLSIMYLNHKLFLVNWLISIQNWHNKSKPPRPLTRRFSVEDDDPEPHEAVDGAAALGAMTASAGCGSAAATVVYTSVCNAGVPRQPEQQHAVYNPAHPGL